MQTSNSGGYVVVVSNIAGTVTSAPPALLAVLTWTNPPGVIYGTPLGPNQLNATASVPGNFSYTPTNGAVLGAGTSTLSVIFTPTDTLNYNSFTDAVSFVVSPAPVTISSGLDANNKVYDGATGASLSSNSVVLAGVLAGDAANVALSTNGYSASFGSATAGTGKIVTVTSLSLAGSAAPNYTLAQPAGLTATIEPRPLTVMAVPNSKAYDGSTSAAATPTIPSGVLQGSDTAIFMESYDNRNVGMGKTLTPSGTINDGNGGANYSVSFAGAGNGTITARPLLVSATGIKKIYDGTTSATVTLSDTRLAGDSLMESYTSATFADRNVGTGKLVTLSGISLTGPDSANYTVNTTATTTADITPALMAITAGSTNKTYGQTMSFSGKEFTAVGLTNGDAVTSVTLSSSGAAAAAPVAGSPYSILVGEALGSGLANYNISYYNGSLTVSNAALAVRADNTNRSYGMPNPAFTGKITGLQNGDNITASYACNATDISPAGQYDIIPTLEDPASKLPNYTVTVVNGVLTVTSLTTSISTILQPGPTLLLSVQTISGSQYVLESKNALADPTWTVAQTNAGNGGILTFSNQIGSNPAGFYRIRVQ